MFTGVLLFGKSPDISLAGRRFRQIEEDGVVEIINTVRSAELSQQPMYGVIIGAFRFKVSYPDIKFNQRLRTRQLS